jgi:aminobenzoyl-glutamate utilization protein B
MVDVRRAVTDLGPLLTSLADQIWDWAELRFQEVRSSALLADTLEGRGFTVTRNVANLPTAFVASWGTGHPVIGFLGEYDALPGLSQVAGADHAVPMTPGGSGHGCGHHALGVGSLGAALALSRVLETRGLPGTVRYYGCPAEEGGSGKTYLVRDGLFDDVDAVLAWHPGDKTEVYRGRTLANVQVEFSFRGRSAHAALAPEEGRSALDAVELMNVGANYLREHIPRGTMFHYAMTEAGGTFPNVVPERASVLYLVRAATVAEATAVMDRLGEVARGAALMTGTAVTSRFDRATSDLIPNDVLGAVLARAMGTVLPSLEETLPFSTDVGDVSQVVPTAQFTGTCFTAGTREHTWQMVSQGKSELAHRGLVEAATILAGGALELIAQPDVIAQARQELQQRTKGHPYRCPIPPEIVPPT